MNPRVLPWTDDPFDDPNRCLVCGTIACPEHLAAPPKPNGHAPTDTPTRTPDTWRLLDDVELMTLPDPVFTVEGILPRRGKAVIYGPPGSCKTTLVASLLLSIATGRNFFGHQVRHHGPCGYVAAEDLPGFKVRLLSIKLAAGFPLDVPVGVYTFPEPIDLRDPVNVNTFIHFMRDTGLQFELVTIDTYASATPGAAENSSEDTTQAMNAATKIQAALDCAVALIHHTNAGGSRERGHTSMRGSADTMISMTPVDDVIHVECSKQRNGPPFEPLLLKLTPVPGAGGVVLRFASDVLPGADLTAAQSKVLGILVETFGETGATKGEWRSACQDVAERTFHRAAKVLEVERHLVRKQNSRFYPVEDCQK